MIEIIPNWHPIFVHFTVALLSLAVGLFVVTRFISGPIKQQWEIVARWALWFGAAITVITAFTGLYAYNTVGHDTPSHVAMTDHRNWAIATIGTFIVLAIWSFIRVQRKKTLGAVFVVAMVAGGALLGSTAWHGGEAVYRFGLGVMSLPKVEGEGHAHKHADGQGHGDSGHGSPEKADADMGDFSMGEEDDNHSDGHDHEH